MAGSSSPSDNYSKINITTVKAGKPQRNDGGGAYFDNPGAGSRMTLNATSALFGSTNKVVNHVPFPNDPKASGYSRATWAVSGQPFGVETKGNYWIDRYSTKIGNVTTTVMSSPSKGLNGRQSIYGTISAFNEPYLYGSGFNMLNGQWLTSVQTASGYSFPGVSGAAPVDQNLHMTRQSQGTVRFIVGKQPVSQSYLGRTD